MAHRGKKDNAKLFPMGPATFPNLWILFCAAFSFFTAISAIPMLFIVGFLWHYNAVAHQGLRVEDYLGNDLAVYGGTLANGYVVNSTIPKQNGGIVFVTMFHLAIFILIIMVMLADLAWYSSHAQGALESLHVGGLQGPRDVGNQQKERGNENQFVFTVFFFKLFTAVCLGTQSLATFDDGNGREPVWSDTDTWSWHFLATWYLVLYVPNAMLALIARQHLFARMAENGDQKNLMITHARWNQVQKIKNNNMANRAAARGRANAAKR